MTGPLRHTSNSTSTGYHLILVKSTDHVWLMSNQKSGSSNVTSLKNKSGATNGAFFR